MSDINFFEVEFSDGNENTAMWICIKGMKQPTIDEAKRFLAADAEMFKLPVAGVYPIDEATARNCYDFSNESNWPIFSE